MDKSYAELVLNKVLKITVALVVFFIVSIAANIAMFTEIHHQDKTIDTYKSYYIASEKLYDEIAEDNEGYFDGDKGCNYLKARKEVKLLNK